MAEVYESYARSPPPSRGSARERDEYRAPDTYRDRRDTRRSPDRRRDRERDRRRSRSPAQIDRYQPDRLPRDDYYRNRDDTHRERRRSSPQPIDRYVPGQEPATPQLLVNPMPDPLRLEFQVGFTWFAEWWRTEQRIKDEKERQRAGKGPPRIRGEREMREERDAERPRIQAAYDQYKANLQKQQAQTFVRLHKDEDWFRERYVAEVQVPFRNKLMDFRRMLFTQWQQDLEGGIFDDFTLEGIYKSESNGLGGILEKEEGETTAAAEVLGVGDLLPSRGGDLRDQIAFQPTLLIKTIAPTVTREKFEAFAKEHLGEGEGGYMHLSLSDPNPLKKCHRMGWIMLKSESEEPQQQEEQHLAAAAGEEGEAADGMSAAPSRPKSTAERALEKINAKTIEDPERGNFTVHCGVHRPPDAPRKKALWDLFSAPERIARDLDLATRLVRKLDNELGDEYFGAAKIEERVQSLSDQGLLQPSVTSKPPKEANMDEFVEDGEEEEEGMVEDEDETDDEELLTKKKKLDLLVEYLRRVYSLCFFCVFESDSVHELQRKCPGGHLRRPRASLTSTAKEVAKASAMGEEFPLRKNGSSKNSLELTTSREGDDLEMDGEGSPVEERKMQLKPSARNAQQLQRAFNWVKTFEEKILQWLEPEKVNLRKLGGMPVEEGVDEELTKFAKQEDTNKFRCKVPGPDNCTKLFKGPDFWRKHVEKRHEDFYNRVRNDIQLVNTYVMDPAHIAPSRSDANSNGHFPLNNNMPTGTPRGFQLSQHMPMGFPMAAAVPGPMAGGMWTPGQPMPMAAAFGAPTMGFPHSGVGPMRNTGRNTYTGLNGFGGGGTRAPGPYGRNDGRGQRMMMGGGVGGLRGALAPGMANGMEGGTGAMGPREAVAGRQLRSYEDLDADQSAGTTELNY
ncbi:hypothetical protein BAUCODRAFT_37388 [Baudoinia panamericana UAMH 10762]|uniref:DUF4187 domain-containing protein n=1 Tax=Baudoinia panamericana (strain UAMH 10762) TaxID=717646 RepID=M2N4M0_BAUPA|nr:uncharacterized protein BAUCODRAFT_37388 [Baudoinia panamericana UAMH 10762]EMC93675.1 hypothetical protein BAUCODRAFT_37388 [Baudoinia panamericana UAMH 10762]